MSSLQTRNRSLARSAIAALALLGAGSAVQVVSACAPTLSPGVEEVVGDWERDEDTLPPIHLRLWVERDTLRARLRLSGSESIGVATLDGSALRLRLSGRPETLVGEFRSKTELELGLGQQFYRLRKTG